VTSASIILGARALAVDAVSSSQVVSSAILGAGSAERLNKVRWGVARHVAVAWLLTIPATALLAGFLYWLGIRAMPVLLAISAGSL